MKIPSTPETIRYNENHKYYIVIRAFLVWLNYNDYIICYDDKNEFYPKPGTIDEILAEYFKIDLKKMKQEKSKVKQYMKSL